MKILLASASPRRQELLKQIFDNFEVHTSSCEENAVFKSPCDYVMELASQKALDVADHYLNSEDETLIIGADTVVFFDGTILGKPYDKSDAYQMIKSISGNTHEVYTGISLVHIKNHKKTVYCSYECTKVHVKELSEDEIATYINTPEPYDKAGSYGIQGLFSRHISGIEGDYFNVVGLPVHLLYEELKNHNLL